MQAEMAVITGGAIAYLIFFMQTRLARAAINGKLLGNWLSSCSPQKMELQPTS